MTTGANDIKSTLVAVIGRAQADQSALLSQLSDAEKAAIGEPDHWVVKDQIAHLNFWRGVALREMSALRDDTEGAELRPSEDDDVVNARTFAKEQYTPWQEVIGEADRLFREAKQVIEELTDAQLGEPDPSAAGGEFTRADRFVTSYLEHPAEHLAQIYQKRGDTARAQEQEHITVEVLRDLSAQRWAVYGYAIYNLGCSYARNGETAKAIAAIGEALPLVPALMEWSRKDPDLDSLRDQPGFQALYTEQH